MLFLGKGLALVAMLVSFCASTPYIRIQNLSQKPICYKVEYSSGTGAFPNETACGAIGAEVAGFVLDPGKSRGFKATGSDGQLFNGAITAMLNDKANTGARNEINFLNPAMPFWDVDYQYGISDGTCGPPNSTHLSGERDTLGKANKAWQTLDQTTKTHLLGFPQYLKQDASGSLTYINMGPEAWENGAWANTALDLIRFFQVTAGFKAYVSPGSVAGQTWPENSPQQELVDLANQQTLSASTDTLLVTSY